MQACSPRMISSFRVSPWSALHKCSRAQIIQASLRFAVCHGDSAQLNVELGSASRHAVVVAFAALVAITIAVAPN